MEEIQFFSYYKEYFGFTNFSRHSVVIDGFTYKTTEHYYQAMKFIKTAPAYAQKIIDAPTPSGSKKLGHSREYPLQEGWDYRENQEPLKIKVMRKAIYAKFTQHEDLKKQLLGTGDLVLKEANPWDPYWGIGRNGNGKNMLGKLLMELRSELRNEGSTKKMPKQTFN